jgi:hypothetical protein
MVIKLLLKIGVNFVLRKAVILIKAPDLLIDYDNIRANWSFKLKSMFININIEFRPGHEFEESKFI